MTNSRWTVLIAAIVLVLVYIIGGVVIVHNFDAIQLDDANSIKPYVAVITKSTTSDFFKEVKAGVDAAAVEYNLDVSFNGPNSEEDFETQNIFIEKAVQEGAKAIVLSAVDYNANAKTVDYAISQGVHVISIDSDVNSEGVKYHIGTDNYLAGTMAGETVLQSNEEKLRIGIVNFDENTANGQEREAGFKDSVEQDSRVEYIVGINVVSTVEQAKLETIELFEQYPDLNVVVTFNEWTSLGVGYAIQELGLKDKTTVVAFDNNSISIGMLETGDVDALIVQNPFAMGYLGVEYAHNLINGIPVQQTDIDTKTTVVDQESMFEEEYQRVLFPFD